MSLLPNYCYIYRCAAKPDMYIYLAEKDDFECIDPRIVKSLGELTFAMALELKSEMKLAKEDPANVIANLKKQKFHLQLPAQDTIESLMAKISP